MPFSVYRQALWYINGKKHYTKQGYEAASRAFKAGDMDRTLAGRNYIVTGANSGIGFEAARAFASRGASVRLLCRSVERGEAARARIVEETGNTNVTLHIADMADASSLKRFAAEVVESLEPVHVLVNNAGCMIHDLKRLTGGVEYNFAVNVMGTYILTTDLLPALRRAKGARVVSV